MFVHKLIITIDKNQTCQIELLIIFTLRTPRYYSFLYWYRCFCRNKYQDLHLSNWDWIPFTTWRSDSLIQVLPSLF